MSKEEKNKTIETDWNCRSIEIKLGNFCARRFEFL
jgi:hypothetical protein